jgi:hypothetical protein
MYPLPCRRLCTQQAGRMCAMDLVRCGRNQSISFRFRECAACNWDARDAGLFLAGLQYSLDKNVCLTYISRYEAHFDVPI